MSARFSPRLSQRLSPKLSLALVLIFTAALAAPGIAAAADEGQEAPGTTAATTAERVVRGSISYRVHCSNCHGDQADGHGPMADILRIAPTDLSSLTARNDGVFPRQKVYRSIDGRVEIAAHGRRGMPIWGLGLQDPGRDTNQEDIVHEQILDLVAYLETLQGH